LCIADGRQRQHDCSIGKIGSCDHILDAIEEHRPRRFKQHFGVVSVELAHREAAAAREPAEPVREPGRQARDVVESERIEKLFAAIMSSRSSRATGPSSLCL
jgi:hypothetical protein